MRSSKAEVFVLLLNKKLSDAEKAIDRMDGVDVQQQQHLKKNPDDYSPITHVDALSTNIHAIYTQLESILKTTLSEIETVPSTREWHRDLLIQAGCKTSDRPELLQAGTIQKMKQLLAFRHMLRNNYLEAIPLDRTIEMKDLTSGTFHEFKADFQVFIAQMMPQDAGDASTKQCLALTPKG